MYTQPHGSYLYVECINQPCTHAHTPRTASTMGIYTVDLEYGSYSPPSLFYLRDKIYISITDIQAQKIWLFDSQAKPLASVPVFGTSAIDLANADADRPLEFVTKGDSNSLIMYQLY